MREERTGETREDEVKRGPWGAGGEAGRGAQHHTRPPASWTRLRVFFNNYFIFNWRIIALQCCVDFCHATT